MENNNDFKINMYDDYVKGFYCEFYKMNVKKTSEVICESENIKIKIIVFEDNKLITMSDTLKD